MDSKKPSALDSLFRFSKLTRNGFLAVMEAVIIIISVL